MAQDAIIPGADRSIRAHELIERSPEKAWTTEPGSLYGGDPRHHQRFQATGPGITDGEQASIRTSGRTVEGFGIPSRWVRIPFSAGHTRRMPRLTSGPFRYKRYADSFIDVARRYTDVPLKQAVISPSALSLMYPAGGIPGYTREQFIDDLLAEHEAEIRRCLHAGAHKVQIDFTEGRLSMKVDPSGHLLNSFIDLNNLALSRFSAEERRASGCIPARAVTAIRRIARTSATRSCSPPVRAECGELLRRARGEKDRARVLRIIRRYMKPDQRIFGASSPPSTGRETPEEVRDRTGSRRIHPAGQLGTTDDCGFSPFSDDTSTSRDTAFAKIHSRVLGTALAVDAIGARR